MAHFNVTFDQKCTTWVRNVVDVVADSQQEAIDKLAKAALHSDYIDIDDDITYEESVELCENEEPMSIKENNGCSTIEILDPRTKDVIWDNVDMYNKSYKF